MIIKTDLSPNCSLKSRPNSTIKYIIFHYTGMQSEIESIKRLKNVKSKVSCHYLINRKGSIIQMVKDNYVAWHAGKSKWKNFINLNQSSIGIELVNKGHNFGYQKFSDAQISSLIKLCKKLKIKYSIRKENFLGHSDIAPLRKLDPGEKFPWEKLSKFKIGSWYYKKDSGPKITNSKKMENLFFRNLFKIGYRYFKINKRSKLDKSIIKIFQQHYRPLNVSGKLDQKTFEISHFLTKQL